VRLEDFHHELELFHSLFLMRNKFFATYLSFFFSINLFLCQSLHMKFQYLSLNGHSSKVCFTKPFAETIHVIRHIVLSCIPFEFLLAWLLLFKSEPLDTFSLFRKSRRSALTTSSFPIRSLASYISLAAVRCAIYCVSMSSSASFISPRSSSSSPTSPPTPDIFR
jgi:hypothetical protein